MDVGLLLLSAAVLGGLSGFLALVLIIAEKYIADYGVCKVEINHDPAVSFECRGGANLLMALAERKIFIPSACGGQGTCGYCKVEVRAGAGSALATERMHLTRAEVRRNVRLSCQVKVKNDLDLRIPAELLAVREFACLVEKLEVLSHDTKLLRLKLLDPPRIAFKPGQYCQLNVPRDYLLRLTPPIFEPVFRAYSIASMPKDSGVVELIIRLVPNGICTTWVHTLLAEGDRVTITGPYGEFYLREDSDRPIICVGGGSGVAPVRSIVEHLFDKGTQRRVDCFVGQRALRDLYWHKENVARAARHRNFRYFPSLSGLEPGDEWEGETEFIHLVVDRIINDAADKECYLCGPPIMIDAVIGVLKDKGLPEERIYFDKF